MSSYHPVVPHLDQIGAVVITNVTIQPPKNKDEENMTLDRGAVVNWNGTWRFPPYFDSLIHEWRRNRTRNLNFKKVTTCLLLIPLDMWYRQLLRVLEMLQDASLNHKHRDAVERRLAVLAYIVMASWEN